MATKKVWIVKFIAGNPEIFTKIHTSKPIGRISAVKDAKVLAQNNWRCWVEHKDTGKIIFESPAESKWNEDNGVTNDTM